MPEEKVTKNIIKLFLLGIIPELAIAFVFMAADNGSWETFGITLAVIFGVYFLIWIRDTIWEWMLFYFGGREEIKNTIFQFLKDNNFPEPDIYTDSAQDYFEEIANNEELSTELRVKAALQLGAISTVSQLGKFHRSIRLMLGMKDALIKFRKSFNNKTVSESDSIRV